MRTINSIIAMVILSSASFIASAQTATQHSEPKIKLYTNWGMAMIGVNAPVDISLVINGQPIIAKNHPDIYYAQSYVEVDKSFNLQVVTQAKFSWLREGKAYVCVADDLPRQVQEGDFYNGGTKIHFACK